MSNYEIVAGLEIHVELSTESKMYCSCKNEFGSEPNTNCCPSCTALPGALPILNKKAVEYAVLMGHALKCTINTVSKQDRKNYFYPDLPKGYQTSQFDVPLCENGKIELYTGGAVKEFGITRVHIEEDTAKLIHDESGVILIDYNRCGVPLIEIVSEPDFRSAEEVLVYLDTIKAILEYLNISDCKMQEGSIRCDVNVSVRPQGESTLGARVEMKNINTFNGAYQAVKYEANRQIEILNGGGIINQETRKWDDAKGISVSMRSKENANDYRYFPEPDLIPLVLDEKYVEELKTLVPVLPNERFIKYVNDYSLSEDDAAILSQSKIKSDFFESCVKLGKCGSKVVSNWILGDISKIVNEGKYNLEDLDIEKLTDMIVSIENGEISNTAGKTVLAELFSTDKTVKEIIKEKNLAQISDASALEAIVAEVLQNNQKSVEDYKSGKTNALGFLVGQCMKASKGQGNPQILSKMLQDRL